MYFVIQRTGGFGGCSNIVKFNMLHNLFVILLNRNPVHTETVISNSTGCRIVNAKSVMNVERNSPHSGADITAGYVGKSSVVVAAIRKYLANSWDL